MTAKQSVLTFRVACKACYGEETWTLGRIARLLTEAEQLPSASVTDIEFIAEQFIAFHKHILCPGCGLTGVLTVQRIMQNV